MSNHLHSVDEETSLRDLYHKKKVGSSMPLHGPGLSLHPELQGPSSSIHSIEAYCHHLCHTQCQAESPTRSLWSVPPNPKHTYRPLPGNDIFHFPGGEALKTHGRGLAIIFLKANVKKNTELYKNGCYTLKKNENVPEKMLTVPPLKP